MDAAPEKRFVRIAVGEGYQLIMLYSLRPLTVTFEWTASGYYVDVLLLESILTWWTTICEGV